MGTSYDVRLWKIESYKGQRGTTYSVRWTVAGVRFRETFKTRALADSFRSGLVTASRKGEGFDSDTGRPISENRPRKSIRWFEFACGYMDMKWPGAAATYRRSLSEALTAITAALIDDRGSDRPDAALLRRALHRWAFNTGRRDDATCPGDVAATLRWLENHTLPVGRLAEPALLRRVLETITVRLDGRASAGSVASKRRRVLFNVLEYAVEQGALAANPLVGFKWKTQQVSSSVDRRTVVSPVQARTLLAAVGEIQRSGPALVAFFALLYFSGLRPEEAANVRDSDLSLPIRGWGEVYLAEATPYAGSDWTDDGRQRDRRQLKNRAPGDGRTVPVPPELTEHLRAHIAAFGVDSVGRLFRGERADELPKLTYMRTWRSARRRAFTSEVAASPLAAHPYDLRHACVSTWLGGGVPAPQVAEWAGHSVEVLLKVYAKTIDGQQDAARRRIDAALGRAAG